MATHWSPLGHVIVFIGVNVGAMGVLTLASILGLVISKRLGLRAKLIAAGDTNPLRAHGGPVNEGQTVRLGEVGQLLATVALSTLVIEAGLAVLLYPSLLLGGVDPLTALWEAPFYAAMSFTNTGFTPNAGGLAPFATDYFFLTVLMAGVFLGSIGFPVIFTLWRHHLHLRRWSLHAKLTIITTVILFFVGAGVFLLLEYDNPKTFGGMDAWDTTFQAFFLSAMTRSGGFSVVDIGELNGSSRRGLDAHVRGGGSASTAGGIKVTTLAVLALAVWSEAKGRPSCRRSAAASPATCSASPSRSRGARRSSRCRPSRSRRSRYPSSTCSSTSSRASRPSACPRGSRGPPDLAVYVLAGTMFMGRWYRDSRRGRGRDIRSQHYSLPVERPIVG
jgi:hypothetical protein